MKVWQCKVCRYIYKGNLPPDKCPVCNVPSRKFKEINEHLVENKNSDKEINIAKQKGTNSKISKKEDNYDRKLRSSKNEQVITTINKTEIKNSIYERFKTVLNQHHAHPISVHNPNGVIPVVVILIILAYFFNSDLFSKVAFINLIFVTLTLPIVLFTGVIEWKKKYNGALTVVFKIKIIAAVLTFFSCAISLIWFIADPSIISSSKSWLFILINIFMLICVSVAGHIGGKLVFKD